MAPHMKLLLYRSTLGSLLGVDKKRKIEESRLKTLKPPRPARKPLQRRLPPRISRPRRRNQGTLGVYPELERESPSPRRLEVEALIATLWVSKEEELLALMKVKNKVYRHIFWKNVSIRNKLPQDYFYGNSVSMIGA